MKKIVFIFLCVFLSSCGAIKKPSFIQDRNKEYLYARSIPPLKIPPGVSSESFTNEYPIPYKAYNSESKKIDLTPPGL